MAGPESGRRPEQELTDVDKIINESLNGIILREHKANEGAAALIYKVDIHDVPADALNAMAQAGIELGDDFVIKTLKVYQPPAGEHEYRAHLRAYSIVKEAADREPGKYALIPEPRVYRKLAISEETSHKLRVDGASHVSTDVEILMMDYIPGEDLSTIFYKWVLAHHPNPIRRTDSEDFNSLRDSVALTLGFEQSNDRETEPEDRKRAERAMLTRNEDKVYAYLKKKGYQLDSQTTQQIKNTVALLNGKGFYHNDLHERNAMVVPENHQAFIIDFATAGALDESTGQHDDKALAKKLETLSETKDSAQEKANTEMAAEVAARRKTIAKNPDAAKRMDRIESISKTEPLKALGMIFPNPPSESGMVFFAAASFGLMETGGVAPEDLSVFIAEKLKRERAPYVQRGLLWLQDTVKKAS